MLGSLYLLLASDKNTKPIASSASPAHRCDCSHCRSVADRFQTSRGPPGDPDPPSGRGSGSTDRVHASPPQSPVDTPEMQDGGTTILAAPSHPITSSDLRHGLSNGDGRTSNDLLSMITRPTLSSGNEAGQSEDDRGYRRKVANTFNNIGSFFGTASRDRFDDSEFQHGAGRDFPEIPGEEHRNRDLRQIRELYNQRWEVDRNDSTGLRRQHSRAGSVAPSIASGRDIEVTPPSRAPSPRPPLSRQSQQPPTSRVGHSSTFPTERPSLDQHNNPTSSSTISTEGGPIQRRDTLEVPAQVHLSHTRSNSGSSSSIARIVTIPTDSTSPVIVLSSDPETSPAEN